MSLEAGVRVKTSADARVTGVLSTAKIGSVLLMNHHAHREDETYPGTECAKGIQDGVRSKRSHRSSSSVDKRWCARYISRTSLCVGHRSVQYLVSEDVYSAI